MKRTLTVLAGLALLAGCTPAETPEPTPTTTEMPAAVAVDPSVIPAPEPSTVTTGETIAADDAIMATMGCAPLSEDLLDRMQIDFGTPTRSVQVEVGEGLTPGEMWWLVILDSPPDDAYKWGLRRFLTNAPGVEQGGKWISLPAQNPWKNVKWDPERLVRAQSALTKAEGCLDD